MRLQQKISNEKLKENIGKEYETLVEDITFDGKYLVGRTKNDVPDIDGLVYIENNNNEEKINKFVNVKITDVSGYDLIGKLID